MAVRRVWTAARDKVEDEGRCRRCTSPRSLEAAHIIPRSRITAGKGGEDPLNIVPLCRWCHQEQHAGVFELLPLLSREEQSYIVGLVGIEEARRRTTKR